MAINWNDMARNSLICGVVSFLSMVLVFIVIALETLVEMPPLLFHLLDMMFLLCLFSSNFILLSAFLSFVFGIISFAKKEKERSWMAVLGMFLSLIYLTVFAILTVVLLFFGLMIAS